MKLITLIIIQNLYFTAYASHLNAEIIVNRFDVLYVNEEYVSGKAELRKINRTQFAFSAEAEFKKDFGYSLYLAYAIYAQFSNQYQLMPLRNEGNICMFIMLEKKENLEYVKQFGEVPTKCPLLKGHYYLKNFIFSEQFIIQTIPWNHVMADVNVTINDRLLIRMQVYATLDRDAVLAKSFKNTRKSVN